MENILAATLKPVLFDRINKVCGNFNSTQSIDMSVNSVCTRKQNTVFTLLKTMIRNENAAGIEIWKQKTFLTLVRIGIWKQKTFLTLVRIEIWKQKTFLTLVRSRIWKQNTFLTLVRSRIWKQNMFLTLVRSRIGNKIRFLQEGKLL
jgi:hypothetical protein